MTLLTCTRPSLASPLLSRTTQALLLGGVAFLLTAVATERLAAAARTGNWPSLAGEKKYRRNVKLLIIPIALGVLCLIGAAISAVVE